MLKQEPLSKSIYFDPASGVQCMIFALIGYLLIASGGIGIGQEFSLNRIAFLPVWSTAFLLLMILLFSRELVVPTPLILSYIIVSVYLGIQVLRTDNIALAANKIDGFLIGGIAVFFIFYVGMRVYGEKFTDHLIIVSIGVLLLTVLYKLNFGFWDRGVRFFINGPNVYGWMLSFAAMLSIHRYIQTNNKVYFLPPLIFMVAIFWTQSKGPMVALTGTIFVYLFFTKNINRLLFLMIIGSLIVFFLFTNDLIPSRYLAIYRYIVGEEIFSDFGSIGSRQLMIEDGIRIFRENPLFGVGIANWDSYTQLSRYGESAYPHNIFIEVIAEHGILGVIIFSVLSLITFFYSSVLGRIVMILFLFCLTFSGDMEYWRFIFALPLALTSYKNINKSFSYERNN